MKFLLLGIGYVAIIYLLPTMIAFGFMLLYNRLVIRFDSRKLFVFGIIVICISAIITSYNAYTRFSGSELIGIYFLLFFILPISALFILIKFGLKNRVNVLIFVLAIKTTLFTILFSTFDGLYSVLADLILATLIVFLFHQPLKKKDVFISSLLILDIVRIILVNLRGSNIAIDFTMLCILTYLIVDPVVWFVVAFISSRQEPSSQLVA
jgi:hypothetical protein